MSRTTSRESDDDPFEDGPLTPERLGIAAGAMDAAVFTYLGHVLFEDPAFGALVGGIVGLGMYLFLPSVLTAETGDGVEERGGATAGGFHRPAAGFALGSGGIVLLATRFASVDLLTGAAAVVVLVAIEYGVVSRLLPRAPR